MWVFVHPWFLWAALAAVIPLILHLMRHSRKEAVYFPTLRFLKLAKKKSARRLRLEHFLIWFLRTLMLLLLALAFALPVVRTADLGGWVGRVERDITIVWDNSPGMDYRSGNRQLWEESRQAVLGILDRMETGDRVSIFLTARGGEPLLQELTSDLSLAASLVRAEQVSPYPGQLAPALAGAVYSLRDSGNREKEVFVVSAGQEAVFREFTVVGDREEETGRPDRTWNPEAVDPSLAFFFHLVRVREPSNTTPLRVEVQPAMVMRETRPRLRATVAHFGPATESSVVLSLNGEEIQRRSLRLGANQEEEVIFNLPPLPAGLHHLRVQTPPDGLPRDDTFDFMLRVRDRAQVGLVGPRQGRFFLERALSVGGDRATIDLSVLEPSALTGGDLAEYSTLFLADALPLADEAVLALEAYVRDGGVLVLFPGQRADLDAYRNWTLLPASPAAFAEPATAARRQSLFFLLPNHAVFRGLQLPPGSIPSVGVRLEMEWENIHEDTLGLLGMGGENVFLQARSFGSGRVLAFSVSADRTWSDFPLSPLFLPLMHQIVQYAAGVREDVPYRWLDPVVEVPTRGRALPEGATLRHSAGTAFSVRRVQDEQGARLQVEELREPGVYHLRAPGQADEPPFLAVNLRRGPSDVRLQDPGDIATLTGLTDPFISLTTGDLERQIEEHRIGKPLAELVLWVLLLVALMEWWLATRASRPVGQLSDSLKVDPSGRVRANPTAHPESGKA